MAEDADVEYPTAGEIHELHAGVVAANDETEPGTHLPAAVGSAVR